jgi:hypothetical protein
MKSSTAPQMVEMSAPSTQRVIAFSRAALDKKSKYLNGGFAEN